jgi:hypothetical protein
MQIEDKFLNYIVYPNNVHQRHANFYQKHAQEWTILQNINQS